MVGAGVMVEGGTVWSGRTGRAAVVVGCATGVVVTAEGSCGCGVDAGGGVAMVEGGGEVLLMDVGGTWCAG